MGGRWSGRRASIKLTIEQCLYIDINLILRQGLSDKGTIPVFMKISGGLRRKHVASINYTFKDDVRKLPVLTLLYLLKKDGAKQVVTEQIALQYTTLCSGGKRWWFTCPLETKTAHCFRRVGKLYLPPGRRYFGCRHGYDLTYRSCQRNHKKDRMFDYLIKAVPRATPRVVKIHLDSIWEKGVQDSLVYWGVEQLYEAKRVPVKDY